MASDASLTIPLPCGPETARRCAGERSEPGLLMVARLAKALLRVQEVRVERLEASPHGRQRAAVHSADGSDMRSLSTEEAALLQDLGHVADALIELQEARRQIEAQAEALRLGERHRADLEQMLALAETVGGLTFWEIEQSGDEPSWDAKAVRTWRQPSGDLTRESEPDVRPHDRATLQDMLRAALGAEGPVPQEIRTVAADGTSRTMSGQIAARRDDVGRARALVGVFKDVTEIERARAELRENANRKRAVEEAAQDAYVGVDAHGYITAWNGAAEAIFGWTAAEAIGMLISDTIVPEHARAAHGAGMARAIRTNERRVIGKRLELTAQDRSGRVFPIEITLAETKIDGVVGFGAFIRDISERIIREKALRESEARYRALIDASAAIVWRAAPDGSIIDAQGWTEFSGQSKDALLDDGWIEVMHPDDHEPAVAAWRQAVAERRLCQVEYRVLHVSGEYRWCAAKGVPLFNAEGEVVEWVGTVTDIHERRQAEIRIRDSEAALRASEERLAHALDSGTDGLWDWNIGTGDTWFSDRWLGMLGYEPGELPGHVSTWERLVHPEDRERAEALLTAHFEGRSPTYECEHRLLRKNGGWSWVLARGRVVTRNQDGFPLRIVGTHIDMTERREVERRIAHMARHDGLTDLPNRTLFLERLAGALSQDSSGHGAIILLLLDLDRFKTVNDTLGHQAGDALLREVARRLRRIARETDTVARLGGDEFAIIRRIDSRARDGVTPQAHHLARQVIDALSGSGLPMSRRRRDAISASVGLAHSIGDCHADDLFRRADLALYRAKADGRETYRIYSADMDEAVEARRRLELDLKAALTRGEFELHQQPILDLATRGICSREALVRWRHPLRGLVPPSEFIPLAEETGMIIPLGEWVLREACRQAAAWPATGQRVSVNISAVQFRGGDLARIVASALATSGLPPERLELEITETVLMDDERLVAEELNRLRGLGVRIALDDFGTGYSSLSYLRQFPINKIKIDRSFIKDIANPDTAAIVRAIVSLARQLGMAITAEGVETEQQLLAVEAEGCSEAQGYFIGRPLPMLQAVEASLDPPTPEAQAHAA